MKHTDASNVAIRSLLGLALTMAAVRSPLGPKVCQAREWIEGQNNSILMVDGSQVYRSTNAGLNWSPISTLSGTASYFTRLSDNSLLLTKDFGWIRSINDGVTWSPVTSFGLPPTDHQYMYGPVIATSGGRWAYCPYYEYDASNTLHSSYTWSTNEIKTTWSAQAIFPAPSDGNKGLTESTIAQIGPNSYVAAIRGDEGSAGAWDGFYLSHSQDGVNWTTPIPTALGERGRMPLFYHIDNSYWLLSYRQYEASTGTQYAAVRLSRDGETWSEPYRFTSGVGTNGFFVESANQWYLFATSYPGGQIMRQPVDLDALANQLLPPVPEPSALVLLISGLAAFGLAHRRVRACLARCLRECRRQGLR